MIITLDFLYWFGIIEVQKEEEPHKEQNMNKELYGKIEAMKRNSAWGRGVKEQALELIDGAEVELTRENALTELLNGAESWSDYSNIGNALIYNGDIAERYCTPSELKKTSNGAKDPNSRESWLDLQARALSQSYRLIYGALRTL